MQKSLKIGIAGTRGIPACYGGFETFAEELSIRLVRRGHQVTVFGREHLIKLSEPEYQGVKLKLLPAPRHKYLETVVHTWRTFRSVKRDEYDLILVCNAANSPVLPILKFKRTPSIVNLDGIERKRKKWNLLGRLWYRLGERCSVWFADKLVADAEIIREYYLKRYHALTTVIRYGCNLTEKERVEIKIRGQDIKWSETELELFSELRVAPERYLLYVSRLEPENNAHLVIRAFNKLPDKLKENRLVIVGDAPYSDEYKEQLRSLAKPSGDKITFAGYRFGEAYRTLQLGALIYIQATEVGGTHPALVEAMGFGNCVIANETPENLEVVGQTGSYFARGDSGSLAARLEGLLTRQEEIGELRRAAYSRALEQYDWERITDQYEQLFFELLSRRNP